ARDGDRTTGEDPHRRAARGSRARSGPAGADARAGSGGAGATRRPHAMSVAPDYAAPLIGWRAWAALEDQGGLGLRRIPLHSRRPPEGRLVAVCRPQPGSRLLARLLRVEPHEAPDEGCQCGIYAACTPDLALPYLGRLGLVRRAKSALIGRV